MLSRSCCRGARLPFRSYSTEVQNASQPSRSKKAMKPLISTAIVLNRSPVLTRSPAPFETAYYSYQGRIRRALHNPFPYDFYFKQGSLLEKRFNIEERNREKRAFGPAFLEKEDITEEQRQADIAAVEQLAIQEGEGETLAPRKHESDTTGDVKSLDRQGQRNLYLLLKATDSAGKSTWRFPQGDVEKGQLLHQAAQKDLHAECGDNMDSWIVGRIPIGVYQPPTVPQSTPETPEHYVFFFKGHIMAGQVKPEGKGVEDFAWLTKEEIETRVVPHYWNAIKDILSDF
ncbi:39S mitochondrial ribosomal protein L46-domain-containing protein [Panaeolus papilionaceus]|nr:39S mitochondrial ribosomal protein L46-domain-containing protein [Panaeolus papilionaceus]